jgi:chorismate mutase
MDNAVAVYIYFDTDTFHNFAETFKNHPLADDLRDVILFSPVTFTEVFTHLAEGNWGQQVHDQINGLHNWVNKDHTGVLPWMDDFLNAIAFGVPTTDTTYQAQLKQDLDVLLNARLEEVVDVAKRRRDKAIDVKTREATDFQSAVEYFRKNPFSEETFTEVWCAGQRKRVKQQQNPKPNADIVTALSAFHEFDFEKLKVALANPDYNILKHKNDLLDAEQLIYLGDPKLHFLVIDRGYLRKVVRSPFRSRIHQVEPKDLATPAAAEGVLRGIIGSSTPPS